MGHMAYDQRLVLHMCQVNGFEYTRYTQAQSGWRVLVLRYSIMAGPGQGWDGGTLTLSSPMPCIRPPGAVKGVHPHARSGLADAGPFSLVVQPYKGSG